MQHVYEQTHTLLLSDSSTLTYRGPAKSTPQNANGGDSCTLNSGNGGEGIA